MQGNVTILVTWANAMQASWCYRGAEALCWWLWVQGASWCYRGAGGCGGGCGCSRGTDAGQLVLSGCWWLCAGALWV